MISELLGEELNLPASLEFQSDDRGVIGGGAYLPRETTLTIEQGDCAHRAK
jgi:hypothetical protein